MDNKIFLEELKNTYESLRYFNIIDNYLILKLDKEYKTPIIHTNLKNLNINLFLLHPTEIFQIIYMLELLYKNALSDFEINFIKDYTKKYLLIEDNNKSENNNINLNRLWCLGLPINLAYDIEFINMPCAKCIIAELNNHTNEIESGRGNYPTLTLKKGENPNFEIEEQNDMYNLEKAGFTTLFLITSTIVATLVYIAYFIIGA